MIVVLQKSCLIVLISQFTKHSVSWENVSGLDADNTNANIINCNSLKIRVLRKNAEVVIVGCQCHILYNATRKASKAFATVSNFDLETTVLIFSPGLKILRNANLF